MNDKTNFIDDPLQTSDCQECINSTCVLSQKPRNFNLAKYLNLPKHKFKQLMNLTYNYIAPSSLSLFTQLRCLQKIYNKPEELYKYLLNCNCFNTLSDCREMKSCNEIDTLLDNNLFVHKFMHKHFILARCINCKGNFHTRIQSRDIKSRMEFCCKKCRICHNCGSNISEKPYIYETSGGMFIYCHNCAKIVNKGNICGICHKTYDDDDYDTPMVACDSCNAWFHFACDERYTLNQYREIEEETYFCKRCLQYQKYINIEKHGPCDICKKDLSDSPLPQFIKRLVYPSRHFGCFAFFNFNRKKENNCIDEEIEDKLIYKEMNEMNCLKCCKSGASVKCELCTDGYYHLECSIMTLFRGYVDVPRCQPHFLQGDYRINKYLHSKERCIIYYSPLLIKLNLEDKEIIFDFYKIYINGKSVTFQELKEQINCKIKEENELVWLKDTFGLSQKEYLKMVKEIKPTSIEDKYKLESIINLLKGESMDDQEISHELWCNSNYSNHTLSYTNFLLQSRNAFILKRSAIQGYGLYATKLYLPNEPIIRYRGEEISSEEANKREKMYGIQSCYMFKLNEEVVIDATILGNLSKYINHSCEPNCYSIKVYNQEWCGVVICAKRVICSDEELTYDYFFGGGEGKTRCLCGTKKCKQFMN
ncbi:putative histone-lysine N-methyltransferase 1 [Astathelohania contejeani]|uniref:Histone-lysine N-methyltransferase 1 n=1 Tax=Astathelohania contejeani TaxID=164912 RepID=A0ABQ7HZT8_9MICR|nr:putative histone-lysine N-methyltransferase 1 [Thelohania contejeani]